MVIAAGCSKGGWTMLFGQQTTDSNGQVPSNIVNDTAAATPSAAEPSTGVNLPTAPADTSVAYVSPSQPADNPPLDTTPVDETNQQPAETPAPSSPAPVDNDLLSLKQQALSDLTPLVDQLEQTPEEKFRTTMMMLQSTDNQALIKEAYAAAQAIPGEKARAQALLDVINEINYFTQQKS